MPIRHQKPSRPKGTRPGLLLALSICWIALLPACRQTPHTGGTWAPEPIKEALQTFVREHARDPDLAGLLPDARSLTGRILREREDLVFPGDWSVRLTPGGLTALWSREFGPDESVRVRVELEAVQAGYRVRAWEVEETF